MADPIPTLQATLQLNEIVHALPWQTEVERALARMAARRNRGVGIAEGRMPSQPGWHISMWGMPSSRYPSPTGRKPSER
jgi:hypothetical protein